MLKQELERGKQEMDRERREAQAVMDAAHASVDAARLASVEKDAEWERQEMVLCLVCAWHQH